VERVGRCADAAEGKHLEVLQRAREHHCPWNDRTRESCSGRAHLDVSKWLDDYGDPH
jgi:hypothetical protein